MPAPKLTKEEKCYWEIKSAMDSKRLRQATFAKRLGYPKGQGKISRWINNIYDVDSKIILEMNDILGIDIFEIMKKYWKE